MAPSSKLNLIGTLPLVGIALSALFFGKPLRLTLLVGGLLVLAGVYVVTRE